MHPVAFTIAGYPVRFAGLLYVLSVIIAGRFALRVARRRGWDSDAVLPGLAFVVTAAYFGARLHGALNDWDRFAVNPLGELFRPGALSFFGGLLSGLVVMVTYIRLAKLPLWETLDALAPIAPVLYAIFRLGCFLNGDDYGIPTHLPWGMTFPDGSPPIDTRVHPTQLYEIVLMIPVMLALTWRKRTSRIPGEVAFDLCVWMALERFTVEYLRSGTGGHGYLSVAQWFALVLGAVGFVGGRWVRVSSSHVR